MTTSRHCLVRCALAAAAAALSVLGAPAMAQDALPPAPLVVPVVPGGADARPRHADFRQEDSSPVARELAHWVVASSDNRNLPFLVIDKAQARVFAFDAQGGLRGATAALLGTAIGDDSVPGIGQRKLSTIRPHERTTPAGRFVAYLDRDIHGEEVLWVDYETSLSLHRIITTQPKERRAQRLASPTPADNRITYGCINVSVAFYEGVVSPLFQRTQGIVYILPETRAAIEVFGSFAVPQQAQQAQLAPAAPVAVNAPLQ
jgi:hypothetical protein